ncbi:MAG: hypothetical protein L0229_11385 [Blastocatellia bacterium]|nr:hypothetical protein [Blastocatellia bacterium]
MTRKLIVATLMATFVAAIFWVSTATTEAQNVIVITAGQYNKRKLKGGKMYLLQGGVFINNKLICKGGAQIFGDTGSFLVVNGNIKSNGTSAEKPVVFTSAQAVGERRRGDWGGIIFNGNAPINLPGGVAEGEGGTGQYGGTDPDDNSGEMRFIRVEYGGFPISPDNELNCIALQGVGRGTTVEFVEAAFGGDDGIEMFGGTVNLRNVISVGASDDSIDWTDGWTGNVQFAVVQQRGDEADNGFEADNNGENNDLLPRSAPRMSNVTMIGAPDPATGPGSDIGMLIREGTAGQFRNFIVMGFKDIGIQLDQQATFDQVDNGSLVFQSIILFNNGPNGNLNIANGDTANALAAMPGIIEVDPQLTDPFNVTLPDFRPQAGSPALDANNVAPGFNDPFFTAAPYVGAFDANDDWTLGWTKWVFGS